METKDFLLLLAGALISLIINYFTQYTSNPIARRYRTWLQKRAGKKARESVEEAKKRMRKLEKELAFVKELADDQKKLNAYAFSRIFWLMRRLFLILTMGFVSTYFFDRMSFLGDALGDALTLTLVLTSGITYMGSKVQDQLFTNVGYINDYEPKVRQEITDLQEVINKGDPVQKA